MKPKRKIKTSGKGSVLTAKQRAFLATFFINGRNASRAAMAAGYAHPYVAGAKCLAHPLIAAEVEKEDAKIAKKNDVTREWIIGRYKRMIEAQDNLAKFKKVDDEGMVYWNFSGATQEELALITEIATDSYMDGKGALAREVKKLKIGFTEPKGALDSLARIFGLFTDNVKHTGEVSLIERLQKGRERAQQDKGK